MTTPLQSPMTPAPRTNLATRVAALYDDVIARMAVLNAQIGVGDPQDMNYREDLAELAGLAWVAARLHPLVAHVPHRPEVPHE